MQYNVAIYSVFNVLSPIKIIVTINETKIIKQLRNNEIR